MAQSAPATVTIANSPHNLNNVGVALPQQQICLPCHTPHNSQFNGGDYIWNHTVDLSKSYTLYTAVHSTRFSGSSPAPVLDTQSRLCLSCHDGAIAVDSYGAGGAPSANSTFMGTIADSFGTVGGGAVGGAAGNDLSSQHPIGQVYPGSSPAAGTGALTWNSAKGSGYNDPTQSSFTAGGVGGSAVSLAVLPNGQYGVGCGTCHTPHTYTYKFVRMDNTGSALCLRCHNK
jgi:predicted CXXCH cytochrome family protein